MCSASIRKISGHENEVRFVDVLTLVQRAVYLCEVLTLVQRVAFLYEVLTLVQRAVYLYYKTTGLFLSFKLELA